MTEKSVLTGWCSNGPDGLHHLCRQFYTSQRGDTTYTCSCECHKVPKSEPVHYVQRRPRKP